MNVSLDEARQVLELQLPALEGQVATLENELTAITDIRNRLRAALQALAGTPDKSKNKSPRQNIGKAMLIQLFEQALQDNGPLPIEDLDGLAKSKAMEESGQDVLGDIFTGAVTYGEHGQFFTPDSVCQLMAELTACDDDGTVPKTVNDPACGSGRFLLSVGLKHPSWEFVGQDVDHRCAQMTAINLGLNGLRGWAVWQNTLTLECFRVYKIGLNFRTGGVIREVHVEKSPFNYTTTATPSKPSVTSDMVEEASNPDNQTEQGAQKPDSRPSQLDLF